jgi:hypothetical protein
VAGCHGRPGSWCALIVLVSSNTLPATTVLDYQVGSVVRHSHNTDLELLTRRHIIARSDVHLVCHLLLYDDTEAVEVTSKENLFK